MLLNFRELCETAVRERASDIIISTNSPISFRIDGDVVQLDGKKLNSEETRELIESIFDTEQKAAFNRNKELDFSYDIKGLCRFRINAYMQKSTVAASIRPIPHILPNLSELNLPDIIEKLADTQRGLILVTGPAGSGKSTTLAAMLDLINSRRKSHIITIEDPIEFRHENKLSIVEQRELHTDTHSFADAIKSVVRQSPDVIMIGELRDLDTISTAITAAEMGHLVLATLHTIDAAQTIHRITDAFPPTQQFQIRIQLAGALQAIIAQQLIPKDGQKGRIPAVEVLISTSAIKNLIISNDARQIYTAIHTGKEYGMQSFVQSLKNLYKRGIISFDNARKYSHSPAEFTTAVLAELDPACKKKHKKGIKRLVKGMLYSAKKKMKAKSGKKTLRTQRENKRD